MNKKLVRIILIICLLTVATPGHTQERDAYWHLYRGHDLFNSNPYNKSDVGMVDSVDYHYAQFLKTGDEYHENYTLGLYLISEFYKDNEWLDKEEKVLDQLVNKRLPEKYSLNIPVDNEPLNYYISALERLVALNIEQGDFFSAMKYADMVEGEELEKFMLRSSRSIHQVRAGLKSDVYAKQDRVDAAINVMLPYILEVWAQSSLDYSQKMLERLLVKHRIKKIQAEVEYSFRGMYQKDVPAHTFDDTKPYFVMLFDKELQVPQANTYNSQSSYDDCLYTLLSSDFYMVVNVK